MSMDTKPNPRRWLIELGAVVRKEVRQTVRDRRVMFLLIAAPLLQTIALGYAVDFDFENVPVLIVDRDHSPSSRAHARRLLADGTLIRKALDGDVEAALAKLQVGDAAATVILPADLERDLLAGQPAEVQAILDGTDPNRAVVVASAVARYFGEAQ